MLKFRQNEDGVINVLDEAGDAIGYIIKQHGVYRFSLQFAYGSPTGLRKIADKLEELNKNAP